MVVIYSRSPFVCERSNSHPTAPTHFIDFIHSSSFYIFSDTNRTLFSSFLLRDPANAISIAFLSSLHQPPAHVFCSLSLPLNKITHFRVAIICTLNGRRNARRRPWKRSLRFLLSLREGLVSFGTTFGNMNARRPNEIGPNRWSEAGLEFAVFVAGFINNTDNKHRGGGNLKEMRVRA